MTKHTKSPLILATAGLALAAPAAHAVTIISDSFETPDISGIGGGSTDEPEPTGWYDSGHPNTAGILHENHGSFTTPYGDQALKVWQGNQEGAKHDLFGATLDLTMAYDISFNVSARDNRTNGDYRAELWGAGVLLDSVEGFVTSNDMSELISHTFDVSGGTNGDALQLRLVDPAAPQVTSAWQDGPLYDNLLLTQVSEKSLIEIEE